MTQYPSVKLTFHTTWFDLLITVLCEQAKENPYEESRKLAEALITKFMTYGKIDTQRDLTTVDLRMFPNEAGNTIWLLLMELCKYVEIEKEYSHELKEKIILD